MSSGIDKPSGHVFRIRPRPGAKQELCDLCKQLGNWYASNWKSIQAEEISFLHHPSWHDLAESASSGCPLCFRLARVAEERYCGGTVEARLKSGKSTAITFKVTSDGKVNVNNGMPWACFEAYVLPDDPAAGWEPPVKTYPRHQDDGLLQVTSTAGVEWLRRCRETHTRCGSLDDSFVPTRLIDVGPPDGTQLPRLIETADLPRDRDGRFQQDLSYIALSHCWGETHHLTSEPDTVAERRKSIPWSLLNQTFKDAIEVTRRFGIRYVWIDSLCIIQGPDGDWEYEASRMGLVYGNCLLNLCADAAEDGDQGFLPPREPLALPYRLGSPSGNDIHGSLWLRQTPVKRLVAYNGDLRRRKWVYQEYILSPRSIRYGAYGLTWECRDGWESADELLLAENQTRGESRALKLFPQMLSSSSGSDGVDSSGSGSGSGSDIMRAILPVWYRLVHDYTRKEVRYAADALPAISGLAALIHAAATGGDGGGGGGGARYLAGVWACDLPGALAWVPEEPRWRAAEYLAPSWSWAAAKTECAIVHPRVTLPFRVDVLEAEVVLEGVSPFGRVRGGYLKMRAWMVPATVRVFGSQAGFESAEINVGLDGTIVRRCPRNHFFGGPIPQVWCMLLAGKTPEKSSKESPVKERRCVLILEEVEGGVDVYRRFDMVIVSMYDHDWNDAENKIITMI